MKCLHKPMLYEAEQFIAPQDDPDEDAMFGEYPVETDDTGYFLTVQTPNGLLRCNDGDWILTDEHGNKSVVSPEMLDLCYQEPEKPPVQVKPPEKSGVAKSPETAKRHPFGGQRKK